jgi:hypothetical protein
MKVMKCDNCGSKDIVAIQGQNYCINCGQLVVPKPAQNSTSSKAPTPASMPFKGNDTPISLPEPVAPHQFAWTLKIATPVALISSLLIALAVWFQADRDIVLYSLLTAVGLTSVMLTMAQAALYFGLSKKQDHRLIDPSIWWAVARSSLLELFNLNLIASIIIGLGFLIAAGAFGLVRGANLLPLIGWGILIAGNVLAAWLITGTFIARRVAVPAVCVGGVGAWSAFALGWRVFNNVGGHVLINAVETIIIKLTALLAVVVLAFWLLSRVNLENSVSVALVGAFLSAVIIFVAFVVALQFDLKVWLAAYRHWGPANFKGRSHQLLAGRQSTPKAKPKTV